MLGKIFNALKATTLTERLAIGISFLSVIIFIVSQSQISNNRFSNEERRSDIDNIAFELEKFYQTNKYYPSSTDFTDQVWLDQNIQSMNLEWLKDPQGNSINNQDSDYSYTATRNDNPCVNTRLQCSGYIIQSKLENNFTNYVKSSSE